MRDIFYFLRFAEKKKVFIMQLLVPPSPPPSPNPGVIALDDASPDEGEIVGVFEDQVEDAAEYEGSEEEQNNVSSSEDEDVSSSEDEDSDVSESGSAPYAFPPSPGMIDRLLEDIGVSDSEEEWDRGFGALEGHGNFLGEGGNEESEE